MLNKELHTKVCQAIEQQFGLWFIPEKWKELEVKLIYAINTLNITSYDKFLDNIVSGRLTAFEEEILLNYLTIGETYFFRESASLEAFKTRMLPELLEQRVGRNQQLNIWCAACSSGEEAYTIAMLLRESIPDIDKWHINLISTDINTASLNKAINGIYTPWSFRDAPQTMVDKYFTRVDANFQVNRNIRNMVQFRRLNLLNFNDYPSDTIPQNGIDVIFCRNALMYFSTLQITAVAQRFAMSMHSNSWLITSPVEVSSEGLQMFKQVNILGCTVFRQFSDAELYAKSKLSENKQAIEKLSKLKTRKSLPDKVTKLLPNAVVREKVNETPQIYLLTEAQKLFDINEYQKAIEKLYNYLKIEPFDTEAKVLMLKALVNLGEIDKAKSLAAQYINLHSTHTPLYQLFASIEMECGNDKLAEQLLRKALYIDNEFIMAHFLMGNLMRKSGNAAAATKHFDQVRRLIQTFPENDILPGFEGISVKQVNELITR